MAVGVSFEALEISDLGTIGIPQLQPAGMAMLIADQPRLDYCQQPVPVSQTHITLQRA